MARKSILLVDDEMVILQSLSWGLQNCDFDVETAVNGQEAIDILLKRYFDLVITDLVMGKVDGLGVLEQAQKIYPNINVIILTGYSDVGSAVKALRLGAYDYLQKPCDFDELLNKVNRSFERQDLLAKLHEQNELLRHEIQNRKNIEIALQESRNNLEKQVIDRTAELTSTISKLKSALVTVQSREKELDSKNKELSDLNTTLGVMLNRRENEHAKIKKEIAAETEELVLPLLKKAQCKLSGPAKKYIEVAQLNLMNIFVKRYPETVLTKAKLAPRELQVVNYLRQDKTSKEIAELLDLSIRTVESYREKIRKKIGIKNQKKNLKKFLTSLP